MKFPRFKSNNRNGDSISSNSSFLPNQIDTGFTLIELMVVISIMALLFGFSYASYREFQRRQVLIQAGNMLITNLRLAQQLAFSGRKEAGCVTLDGYAIERRSDTSYAIEDRCIGGGGGNEIKLVTLPPNIEIDPFPSPGNEITFYVLGRGISRTSDVTLNLRLEINSVTIESTSVQITTVGEIK